MSAPLAHESTLQRAVNQALSSDGVFLYAWRVNRRREIRALESLIQDWAEWQFLRNAYPSSTAECHAGEGVSSNRPGSRIPKGVTAPRKVTEVNTAVHALGDFHPHLRQVIAIRYECIDAGRPRNRVEQEASFILTARRSPRTYYNRLKEAHEWLIPRLI